MGLDISFNREQAIKAGLELVTLDHRHDLEDISTDLQDDLDFMRWANEKVVCIKVPETGHLVEDDGVPEYITVRANKWGRTYYPLTDWLKANNIEWDEF
jgi:hypothetical protein